MNHTIQNPEQTIGYYILLYTFSFLLAAAPVEASPRVERGWKTTLPGGKLTFEMKPAGRASCNGPIQGRGTMTRRLRKKRTTVKWSTR